VRQCGEKAGDVYSLGQRLLAFGTHVYLVFGMVYIKWNAKFRIIDIVLSNIQTRLSTA